MSGCPDCDRYRSEGAAFCGMCGAPLERSWEGDGTVRAALCVLTLAVSLLAVAELCYLAGGTLTVWDAAAGLDMDVLLLVPWLVSVGTVSGLSLQIAWVLIEVAIAASVAALAWHTVRYYRRAKGAPSARLARTPLYWTCAGLGASIAVTLVINLVQMAFGSGIDTPDGVGTGNTPSNILDYADAAVWEEVISRLIPIGVPMAVAGALCKRRDAWRFLFGGFGMSKLAAVLIVLSALMFGFAHEGGWGLEKVPTAAVTGLIMGWLFVRYGIHATIFFHFANDFLAVVAYTDLMAPVALLLLLIIVAGAVAACVLAARLWRGLKAVGDLPNWVPPGRESIFSRSDCERTADSRLLDSITQFPL